MRRSFYQYVQTLKGPSHLDGEQIFATAVCDDIQFPKQSEDYNEISSYLEMETYYVENMDLFDQIWRKYLDNND